MKVRVKMGTATNTAGRKVLIGLFTVQAVVLTGGWFYHVISGILDSPSYH